MILQTLINKCFKIDKSHDKQEDTRVPNSKANNLYKYVKRKNLFMSSELFEASAEVVTLVNTIYRMIHPRYDEINTVVECNDDESEFHITFSPKDMSIEGLGGEIIGVTEKVHSDVARSMYLYLKELMLDAEKLVDVAERSNDATEKRDAIAKKRSVGRYMRFHKSITNRHRQGRNIEEMRPALEFILGMYRRSKMMGQQHSWNDYRPNIEITFIDARSQNRLKERQQQQ
jgi:hypothetical protein